MSRRAGDRGVAILTVVTALVALLVVALPFAVTMRRGYEASRRHNARAQARRQVDSTLRFLEAFLANTTERAERMRRAAGEAGPSADPGVDSLEEITPTRGQLGLALGADPDDLQDPYGTIVAWQVEDENGKLDINSASMFALGNLLGMGFLREDVGEADTVLVLEDAGGLPERGYVKVGRELVRYGRRDGNRLLECRRGEAEDRHGPAVAHAAGDMVVRYAAWAIASYAVERRPGEFSSFTGLDVADIVALTPGLDPDPPVLTKAEWDALRPYVTCWSRGERGDTWSNPEPLAAGSRLPCGQGGADAFRFADSTSFNQGALVQLREDGGAGRVDYGMVLDAAPVPGTAESRMELFGGVHRPFDGHRTRVARRARNPVNANTAQREVLVALFRNLQLRVGSGADRVTAEEAARVADAILERRANAGPLAGLDEFHDLLDGLEAAGAISRRDHDALFRNALDSLDQGLRFGTAPLCFRTFDVYTLRASVTLCDRGGRQRARHAATRVVAVGTQTTALRLWETQSDFEEQLVQGNDARFWTTGPAHLGQFVAPHVEPWPRWQRRLAGTVPRDPERTGRGGFIRPSPARMEFDTSPVGALLVEHFDHEPSLEGHFAEEGYVTPLHGPLLEAVDDGHVLPFSIQFWWKPDGPVARDVVLFDVAESEWRSRYACYVDAEGDALVFAVADNTEAAYAAELRCPLERLAGFGEDVWFHIHLVAAGCHPSKMQMIVDGRALGEPNVQALLARPIAPEAGEIPLEACDGFPPCGAVLLGTEVVEYEALSASGLVVRRDRTGTVVGRGARGTLAAAHPAGASATLFGYARPLVEGLRRGGAVLEAELGPWAPVAFDTASDGAMHFAGYYPPVGQPFSHAWAMTPEGGCSGPG